jgi:hypothetical protein
MKSTKISVRTAGSFITVLTALLLGIPISANSDGKKVYEVADEVAKKADTLLQENKKLSDRISTLEETVITLTTRIGTLETQMSETRRNALWDAGLPNEFLPPDRLYNIGQKQCDVGGYVVGITLSATTYGLNGVQLLCHKLTSGMR